MKLVSIILLLCLSTPLYSIDHSQRGCLSPVTSLQLTSPNDILLFVLTYLEKKLIVRRDLSLTESDLSRSLLQFEYFSDSRILEDFHSDYYSIWFIDHKRHEVWDFRRKGNRVQGKIISIENFYQFVSQHFATIDWENLIYDADGDRLRATIKEKLELFNYKQKPDEKLDIFIGRFSKEKNYISGRVYIPCKLGDNKMGIYIDKKRHVRLISFDRLSRIKIKARITNLMKKYEGIHPPDFHIGYLMRRIGEAIHKNRREISKLIPSLNPEQLRVLNKWFYKFCANRDHGYFHALKDWELILKQLDYLKQNYNFDKEAPNDHPPFIFQGRQLYLQDIDLKLIGIATMLHDVTAIINRKNHNETGAALAKLILPELDYLKLSPEDIDIISDLIIKHRGYDYIPPTTFSEHLLACADEFTGVEMARMYGKKHDRLAKWYNPNISFSYRMMALSGVFIHESFVGGNKTDPAIFDLYGIFFRGMPEFAYITYGNFAPIKGLLEGETDKQILSLKRQMAFEATWDDVIYNKTLYASVIDGFYRKIRTLLKLPSYHQLFKKYSHLMPLFLAPTEVKFQPNGEKDLNYWKQFIRPELLQEFEALRPENQSELLALVQNIFDNFQHWEDDFKHSTRVETIKNDFLGINFIDISHKYDLLMAPVKLKHHATDKSA